LDKLRQDGLLPPAGALASPLCNLTLTFSNHVKVPQLAFGMYTIPGNDEGETVLTNAISAGYRHFDGASYYKNEVTLGRALRKSGIPREQFFITSKVWNDSIKAGREAVRESVLQSTQDIGYGDYLDLVLLHWPVPHHFIPAYNELELLCQQGKIKSIGLSNFNIQEYEELVKSGLTIPPVVNQFQVSSFLYRKDLVDFFTRKKLLVTSSKSLHRGASLDHPDLVRMAEKYSATAAQIMIRWGVQKGLIVAVKTSSPLRMKENLSVTSFSIDKEDMNTLDSLTTDADIKEREKHEMMSKSSI
jgi:diketogulonate reductase-like aldo/keto reductase